MDPIPKLPGTFFPQLDRLLWNFRAENDAPAEVPADVPDRHLFFNSDYASNTSFVKPVASMLEPIPHRLIIVLRLPDAPNL
jgi:hypothetical protein